MVVYWVSSSSLQYVTKSQRNSEMWFYHATDKWPITALPIFFLLWSLIHFQFVCKLELLASFTCNWTVSFSRIWVNFSPDELVLKQYFWGFFIVVEILKEYTSKWWHRWVQFVLLVCSYLVSYSSWSIQRWQFAYWCSVYLDFISSRLKNKQ